MAGLFQTTMAELYEMHYQNEFDYLFDSSKFQNAFGVQPVSYLQGIKETIQYYQQKKRDSCPSSIIISLLSIEKE
ncbi:MAG: hypothetical protein M1381_01945 [Deltaproteobacteria bacterium]|nr:hypothetical protein [Deltaproteobacteria bacterium]MCL5793014.1 hypothetical protein [Deltaproteobacteria bacterium]